MSYSWWEYAIAWGTALVLIAWLVILTAEIAEKIGGLFSGHSAAKEHNEYLVQQLYAENVNVNRDPTLPEYGATHNAEQRRRR